MTKREGQQFTYAELRQILARASELDSATSDGVSIAALHALADDAGIRPAALEAALGEYERQRPPQPPPMDPIAGPSLLPQPRYRISPAFERYARVRNWPMYLPITVILAFVFWQKPSARPLALLLPCSSMLFVAYLALMLRMGEPSFRSRVNVAVAGAVAGLPLGPLLLAVVMLVSVRYNYQLSELITGKTIVATAISSVVAGAVWAQFAVRPIHRSKRVR